ncbi:hypothetical protein M422DRAFT_264421 [Sphaerobolus stellatus SS14]|uniref:Uncharacterized protein n=1 Tax=Sphaerobolus stellatus (strain SS14) TaxID=990650 RepID=A0A0C9V878_SPHS4|nr:hypothetical protein M422DRAFT_264421 [Sphaerobolus stellatus SS14]
MSLRDVSSNSSTVYLSVSMDPAQAIQTLKTDTTNALKSADISAEFRTFCNNKANDVLTNFVKRNASSKVVQISFVASIKIPPPGSTKLPQIGFAVDSDSANPTNNQPNPHLGLSVAGNKTKVDLISGRFNDPTYEPWRGSVKIATSHADLRRELPYVRGDGKFNQSLDDLGPDDPNFAITYIIRVAK